MSKPLRRFGGSGVVKLEKRPLAYLADDEARCLGGVMPGCQTCARKVQSDLDASEKIVPYMKPALDKNGKCQNEIPIELL